jgi:hypothetical protein
MLKRSTLFLQAVTVLTALAALAMMIRLPLTEGRAQNLDLLNIYTDPFILYAYAASIPFFIALYKIFSLLGLIGRNKAFSLQSVKTLRSIRYCALALVILIMMAGLYIKLFHNKDDDPAGFLALCGIAAFAAAVIAAAASVFENILQNGMDLKSGKEQLDQQGPVR